MTHSGSEPDSWPPATDVLGSVEVGRGLRTCRAWSETEQTWARVLDRRVSSFEAGIGWGFLCSPREQELRRGQEGFPLCQRVRGPRLPKDSLHYDPITELLTALAVASPFKRSLSAL